MIQAEEAFGALMSGRRAFGSVRQLPSGRWQARYRPPDGVLRTAPMTFPTKTGAQKYLAGVEADLMRGKWIDPSRQEPTLGEYADAWLLQRRVRGRALAPRTVDTYRHSLDAWIRPQLGDLALSEITSPLVRTWHASVSAATGPTATRQAYALLKAVMNTAVQDEVLIRNPCNITGAGQARAAERPLLSLEDVSALAGAMPGHLRPVVIVAFWAHARLGELLGLRRCDVDLEARTLRIERQIVEVDGHGPLETACKYESCRTVHLSDPAITALAQHLLLTGPALPTARLFVHPDGMPLRAHHVHAAWKTAVRRADLLGVHVHDLRHAGLTFVAQAGATVAELMRRGGHASSRAALTYQHAAEHRDAELAERMTKLASTTAIRASSAPS